MRNRKLIFVPLLMAALLGGSSTAAVEFATVDGNLVTELLPGLHVL